MKFFIAPVPKSVTPDAPQSTVEVPNKTIALAGFIVTSIQVLATVLGNYLAASSKIHIDKELNELKKQNFKVQLLQRVLDNNDSVYRASSLRLLIAEGLINDPEHKIDSMCNNPKIVPRWTTRPLEAFVGTPTPTTTTIAKIADATKPSPPVPVVDSAHLKPKT